MNITLYISGVASGPNPTPGVGVSRSLRVGIPGARLIAVDYHELSSGLSWSDFDESRLLPNPLKYPAGHLEKVRDMMVRGSAWLSTSDQEIWWMSEALADSTQILTPSRQALLHTVKPAEHASRMLGIPIPLSASIVDKRELHAFCRRVGWNIWVKGPMAGAVKASDWGTLNAAIDSMARLNGGLNGILAQQHIEGQGESIAFCALSGTLLGSVAMLKRAVTPGEKTWTATISPTPQVVRQRLEEFVAATGWTGGGEIEMIRDARGVGWLMEINPRFPAWIHGATIAGINLPARLVGAACRIEPLPEVTQLESFTRVVLEIPFRSDPEPTRSA